MQINPSLLSVAQNPFAVITIIAAPAILTNASSIIGLTTGGRLLKCLDTISQLEKKVTEEELSEIEYSIKVEQLKLAYKQSKHFLRALRSSYISLGSFAFSCFLALVGSVILFFVSLNNAEPFAIITLLSGGAGVLGLVWSSVELFLASRLTVKIMDKSFKLLSHKKDIVF
ncbi:MAG: DUF2721 domain-containing protein [Bdellovibrionales bacterium]|nr:DUF2721 domain-containing protein [Bdellovibrionales bacterium]